MIQLKGSGLPAWSQVSDRRLAHIQRVTSLLRAWGAANHWHVARHPRYPREGRLYV